MVSFRVQEKKTIPIIWTGKIQYEQLLTSNGLTTKKGQDISKEDQD